jgi:hypothetical protein
VCLSANKDTTWVIDSGAKDHIVKENMPVINKYKLSVSTKIQIAGNNNYLLAYENGDVIAEAYVNGEVRNIRIPDVFLVKDFTYNLLSMPKLEKKGFIITMKNGGADIAKDETVIGIANRKGNLYKMNMIMKKTDDSRAYSALNMNNSKVSHTRMRHEGNVQFQQSAKTVDGMNVKMNSDVPAVCEMC